MYNMLPHNSEPPAPHEPTALDRELEEMAVRLGTYLNEQIARILPLLNRLAQELSDLCNNGSPQAERERRAARREALLRARASTQAKRRRRLV